jgi:selenocysteine lyase/cysteine desulfurase
MKNSSFQSEFKLKEGLIYLNHASVSPWPIRTSKAVQSFAEENLTFGSRHYPEWLNVESNLRRQAKELLNAQSADEIALLKNTSEALSVVAYGLDWQAGDNIVSTDQEFPSNRIVWESLSSKGVEFRETDLGAEKSPEDAIFTLTDSNTRLITVSSVQYLTGLRLDLEKIGAFCNERGILFSVDAIQSLGALEFDVQRSGAHFVMADGHKWMFGPEGLAIFYCNSLVRDQLSLQQYGWHMVEHAGDFDRRDWSIAPSARRFECGSPNMLGIHALNASLSLLLEAEMNIVEQEVLKRSAYLIDMISAGNDIELISASEHGRYAGIVTFKRANVENESLYNYLMSNNVICAYRGGAVRFSPHFYTPLDHLEKAMKMVLDFDG